ncbi:MAG: SDR family NAD(P)-dependent oxidoreductase [Halolamina sp.]
MTDDGNATDSALYDSLDGQVALVTGANRGIGAEIARQLAALDATVYAGVRSTDREVPEGTERVVVDVTQEGDVQAALNDIGDGHDALDVLVNNAGVGGQDAPIHEVPTYRLDHTLGVNLRGPMVVAKNAVPPLLESEAPRVVNVSSGMGALGEAQSGEWPAYRIAKTGLNGLTRYLDGEYGDRGLMANSVCPGWVRTRMGGDEAERSVERGAETPVWLCRLRSGGPSGAFWRDRERIEW